MNVRKYKQKMQKQYRKEQQANAILAAMAIPISSGTSPKSALVTKTRTSVKIQTRPMQQVRSVPIWERIETDKKTGGVFLTLHGRQATFANGAEASLHSCGFVYSTRWTKYLGDSDNAS